MADIENSTLPMATKIFLIFLLALAVLVSLSTRVNSTPNKDDTALTALLRCWSLSANTRLLFHIDKSSLHRILHGIRGFSVIWFTIGNFLYLHSIMLTENMLLLKDKIKDVGVSFILNYSLSEDSIIFVIGVFSSLALQRKYVTLRPWLCSLAYIVLRLLPMASFFMAFVTIVLPYLGSGPTWALEMNRFTRNCSTNWWQNVLMINNFFPRKQQCMEQLWFPSFIIQSFVFGSLLAVFVMIKPYAGQLLFLMAFAMTVMTTAVLTVAYDSGPTLLLREYREGSRHVYFDQVYSKFYTRGGIFLVGIWSGMLFVKHQDLKLSQKYNILGWISSVVMLLTLIHFTYFWNQGQMLPGTIESSVYAALHRVLWTLPLLFMILSCIAQRSNYVLWFFSWRVWQVCSRLTYAILLTHPYVILYSNGVARSPFFFSYDYLSYLALHHVVATVVASYLLSVLVERPIIAMLKLYKSCQERKTVPTSINVKPTLPPILLVDRRPAVISSNSFEMQPPSNNQQRS